MIRFGSDSLKARPSSRFTALGLPLRLLGASVTLTWSLACGTEPNPARDLTAPFQTSALQYVFTDDGYQWNLSVPVSYTNNRSLPVRLDYCDTSVQRRSGFNWSTVYTLPCPLSNVLGTDSIPPNGTVEFTYAVHSPHDPNTAPRLPEPLAGIYRVIFGLRERQNPNPGLIVWQAIPAIEDRRSNEFAASLPH